MTRTMKDGRKVITVTYSIREIQPCVWSICIDAPGLTEGPSFHSVTSRFRDRALHRLQQHFGYQHEDVMLVWVQTPGA